MIGSHSYFTWINGPLPFRVFTNLLCSEGRSHRAISKLTLKRTRGIEVISEVEWVQREEKQRSGLSCCIFKSGSSDLFRNFYWPRSVIRLLLPSVLQEVLFFRSPENVISYKTSRLVDCKKGHHLLFSLLLMFTVIWLCNSSIKGESQSQFPLPSNLGCPMTCFN